MKHKKVHVPRIVPWRDWHEWSEVKDALFSELPSLRYHGLLRVAAWRSRGTVPLSIDATAQLVEISMQVQNIKNALPSSLRESVQFIPMLLAG